ncbi:putative cytoplasmic protein, SciI [Chthoniobacter flavus Ellin428]|uniref:Putative cytoplasmic protein, SciI n=1 Tax=Chthoniobacter flavus Ellin428 TaxID=497964 RepID=B4D1P7_9BACT|nr:type VI secretion system contractile sheath large subunit [Chthoniobacter flavus]EDY19659.1 putative cytoplasmic protein, SciI [Chthoniobacter flavus Ellin428]
MSEDPLLQNEAAPAVEIGEVNEFEALLQQEFKPKTSDARQAVESAVRTLAEQALAGTALIGKDAITSIQSIIAELDKKLSEQINLIIHHDDFVKLEGTWRGLHYLVSNTETDEKLKIRVMNIGKKDLGRTLKKFKGTAWDQSPLFKKDLRKKEIRHAGVVLLTAA